MKRSRGDFCELLLNSSVKTDKNCQMHKWIVEKYIEHLSKLVNAEDDNLDKIGKKLYIPCTEIETTIKLMSRLIINLSTEQVNGIMSLLSQFQSKYAALLNKASAIPNLVVDSNKTNIQPGSVPSIQLFKSVYYNIDQFDTTYPMPSLTQPLSTNEDNSDVMLAYLKHYIHCFLTASSYKESEVYYSKCIHVSTLSLANFTNCSLYLWIELVSTIMKFMQSPDTKPNREVRLYAQFIQNLLIDTGMHAHGKFNINHKNQLSLMLSVIPCITKANLVSFSFEFYTVLNQIQQLLNYNPVSELNSKQITTLNILLSDLLIGAKTIKRLEAKVIVVIVKHSALYNSLEKMYLMSLTRINSLNAELLYELLTFCCSVPDYTAVLTYIRDQSKFIWTTHGIKGISSLLYTETKVNNCIDIHSFKLIIRAFHNQVNSFSTSQSSVDHRQICISMMKLATRIGINTSSNFFPFILHKLLQLYSHTLISVYKASTMINTDAENASSLTNNAFNKSDYEMIIQCVIKCISSLFKSLKSAPMEALGKFTVKPLSYYHMFKALNRLVFKDTLEYSKGHYVLVKWPTLSIERLISITIAHLCSLKKFISCNELAYELSRFLSTHHYYTTDQHRNIQRCLLHGVNPLH